MSSDAPGHLLSQAQPAFPSPWPPLQWRLGGSQSLSLPLHTSSCHLTFPLTLAQAQALVCSCCSRPPSPSPQDSSWEGKGGEAGSVPSGESHPLQVIPWWSWESLGPSVPAPPFLERREAWGSPSPLPTCCQLGFLPVLPSGSSEEEDVATSPLGLGNTKPNLP